MKYQYLMKYRSVAPGAQPKGVIDWQELPDKTIITYERKLTEEELKDYELEEVSVASTEAHKRAVAKYNAKAYDPIVVRFLSGELDDIKAIARESGESINAFIVNAVKDKVARLRKDEEK